MTQLEQVVAHRIDQRFASWWDTACHGAFDRVPFLGAFSGAGRRLGKVTVQLTERESAAISRAELDPQGWALDHFGRTVLLLSALRRIPEDEHQALVAEVYRTGDLREREAVLRALPHLPAGERFVDVAHEGVRTNAVDLLAAIALDNAYPARHLRDEMFNQMVMKSVFMQLPLARVEGLVLRLNPELARMAQDFAAERRAANRPVPEDLQLLLA